MGELVPFRSAATAAATPTTDQGSVDAEVNAFHERCFDRFRKRHSSKGYTPKYVKKCLDHFCALLAWVGKPVFVVQEADYEAWCDDLANVRHNHRNTQRTKQAHVRQVIKYLFKAPDIQSEAQRLFGRQIALFAHPDNSIIHTVEDETEGRRTPITQDEMDKLYASLDARIEKSLTEAPREFRALCRDKVMIFAMYTYGLRASEVGPITIDDWRPDHELPECGTYAYLNVRYGKGAKGSGKRSRPCPSTDPLITGLMDWYLQAIRPLYDSIAKPGFERHVFLSERGTPVTVGTIESRFAQHLKAAGFPEHKYAPHSLRRSMVTHQLICGMGIEFAKDMAGHADSATTCIYGQVPRDITMRSAARLTRQRADALLKSGK